MENWFAKISWIMTYKKLDYSRSTEIQKYYNINLNVTFSKLAILRKNNI
jgi:hypothetical protein